MLELMMMVQSQFIKGNGVNNIFVLFLKELNMYYLFISVLQQYRKYRFLIVVYLNDEMVYINLGNRFYLGGKIVFFIYES